MRDGCVQREDGPTPPPDECSAMLDPGVGALDRVRPGDPSVAGRVGGAAAADRRTASGAPVRRGQHVEQAVHAGGASKSGAAVGPTPCIVNPAPPHGIRLIRCIPTRSAIWRLSVPNTCGRQTALTFPCHEGTSFCSPRETERAAGCCRGVGPIDCVQTFVWTPCRKPSLATARRPASTRTGAASS